MRKIDAHCHTTNRPLPDSANPDASLAAILALMEQYQVVRTVVLATYFPRRGTGISNYRLYEWIRGRPELAMFGSLDFEHYFLQGYNELEEMAQHGLIRGIKLYTAYQDIDFDTDEFRQVARLAREHALPLMFHGGVSYDLWRRMPLDEFMALADNPQARPPEPYKRPRDFAAVAQAFPDVQIIVSHLGKPFFREMIDVLKAFANVYTDISGILDSKRDARYREACAEQVRRFVGECGPGKILFGTDFPVQTHQDAVYFVEQAMAGYAAQDRGLVYFGNAQRLIFGRSSD